MNYPYQHVTPYIPAYPTPGTPGCSLVRMALLGAVIGGGYLGGGPVVSTAVTLATGTGVMYLLNPE